MQLLLIMKMASSGKTISCRAAVAWEMKKPYTIEEVEVGPPQPGEVRVKMCSAGICHSDLHQLEGMDMYCPLPSVFGHEGAGIIVSVGERVCNLQTGDIVVLCFVSYCGECDYCENPKTHMCRKTYGHFQRDGTTRITCRGQPLSQMNKISTFSEYTVTSEHNVAKVNPKADPFSMCLAGCCIPTGYGAVMNAGRVSPGSTCAVWGLGGVGMCAVMGCRDSGATTIIGVDTNPNKFSLAIELGCTHVLNPTNVADVPHVLAEMTNGGVDFCFVAVGAIPAMEEAFKSSHPAWGKTVLIGLTDVDTTMRVEISDLLKGRHLLGTHYGGYKPKKNIPDLVEKVLNREIQLEKLITHRLPLDKINEAFHMLKTGESLRAIIDFRLQS